MKNFITKSQVLLQIKQENNYSDVTLPEVSEDFVEDLVDKLISKLKPTFEHKVEAAYLEVRVTLDPKALTKEINDHYMDYVLQDFHNTLNEIESRINSKEHINEDLEKLNDIKNFILNYNRYAPYSLDFISILKSIYNLEQRRRKMKNHFNSQTNRLIYIEGKISAYQNIRAEFEYKQPNMIRKNLEFYIQELTKDRDQLLQTYKQKQN